MEDDLKRVRADLGVMEQAIGIGLPFGSRDVQQMWTASLLGVPLVILALVTNMQAPWPGLLIVVTLLGVFGLLSTGHRADGDGSGRGDPVRARERRLGVFTFVILSSAGFAYLFVAVWGGLSTMVALASAVFFIGVASAIPAGTDPRRKYLYGSAFPTMAFGAVLPLLNDDQLMLATGLWVLFAGTWTAAIMKHQLGDRVDGGI